MSRRKKEQLTAIDLFAGAGGTTKGLSLAGFNVAAAVEFDRTIAKSYAANHASVRLYETDIREVDPEELKSHLPSKLDLLNACPPCQGFSSLGTGNEHDKRNDLVSEVWRFTKHLKPRAIVLENVPGLRSDRRLQQLTRQLRSSGYRVRSYVINATEFGVPQKRKRLIVLAIRSKVELPDSLPDALPRHFRRTAPHAAELLLRLEHPSNSEDELHKPRTQSPTVKARIKSIPRGGNRFDLPEKLQLKCHQKLSGRNATSSYGRIPLTGPSPTMTTRCTTPACGSYVHPRQNRGITLREAAMLQTFPRHYRFIGFHDQIERQIGNAVPVRLARGIGMIVKQLLSGAQ